MPVPSIVIASEPPLWCASFYQLFAWQRPIKNQINEMQNICILLFVSCYYAWQVKQINILCLVHAIAIGSCIAGCNVAIVMEAATWLTARMAHFCNDPKYDMMHLCKRMSKDRILSIF